MQPFLFVTDLDHTLVGDDAALAVLNQQLSQHREAYGTKIVYATGRSRQLYHELATEKNLLEPDILVLSVGTEIYHQGQPDPAPQWVEQLSHQWNREQIVATTAHYADLIPQPESEQQPFKVSFYLSEEASQEVLPRLESQLKQKQLNIRLIYSSGQDLDIIPGVASKGAAVTFLQQQLGIEPDRTVVCGDSGNDIALFEAGKDKGIIVGNAQSELVQWHNTNPNPNRYFAQSSCAGGILEGLKHFGFLEP